MDSNISHMVSILRDVQESLKPYEEHLKTTEIAGLAHPDRIISNFNLLCDTLLDFYSEDKRAVYLPFSINKELQSAFTSLKGIYTQTAPDQLTPETAQNILTNLDACYTISLKYGLITFGFDTKRIQFLVTSATTIHDKITDIGNTIHSKVADFDQSLEKTHAAAKSLYDELVNKVQTEISGKIKSADESLSKIDSAHNQLKEKILQTTQIADNAQVEFAKVQEVSKSITTTQTQAMKDSDGLKSMLAESKAILETVKETKQGRKAQFDNIQQFYSEIEANRKKIADIKKTADENYNQLSEETSVKVSTYTIKTDEIVAKNRSLQQEITEHLRRAVSGSLFSAFAVRSKGLNLTKWVWTVMLAVCVGIGVWLTITIAHDLAGVPDRAFFVKLSSMLPVLFLLGFSARQYTKERRTEEEYAFKSAISISLEAYRDLLDRINKDQGPEAAAYVKKLIDEIFDNPVKRIYPHKETLAEPDDDNILGLRSLIGTASGSSLEHIKVLCEIVKNSVPILTPKG